MMRMDRMFQRISNWYYNGEIALNSLIKVIEIHFDGAVTEERVFQEDILFENFNDFEKYSEKFKLFDALDYETGSLSDNDTIDYIVIYLIR